MVRRRRRESEPLIESYGVQLGLPLDHRQIELALVVALRKAERAAEVAKEAMVAAQAADRAKSEFLANMSHELRTPLNAIIGFSEIIKLDDERRRQRYPEYAGYVHEAALHLLGIVNDILDLARIESGKAELEDQSMPLPEVTASAIQTIRPLADNKSIAIACSPALADFVIRVDGIRFKQVLLNVLGNAVKFTEPGGRVGVDAAVDAGGALTVSISDTGIGIATKDLGKVLEPFELIENPLTRSKAGTGLGLPIARALMMSHDGELGIDSQPGIGTTVRLRLPPDRVRRADVGELCRPPALDYPDLAGSPASRRIP